MTVGDQVRKLRVAMDALNEFSSIADCSWCSDKARQMRDAISELEQTLPIAQQLKDRVNVLAKDNIGGITDEIRQYRDQNAPEEKRLPPLGREPQRPSPHSSPAIGPVEVPSQSIFGGDGILGGGLFGRKDKKLFGGDLLGRSKRSEGGGILDKADNLRDRGSNFRDRERQFFTGEGGPLRRRLRAQ